MAVTLPQPPKSPDPKLPRLDATGRPTPAVVSYESKLEQFLKAVKAAVEAM
jgi:hypothetical protein